MGEKIVRLPPIAPPSLSEADKSRLRRLAHHGAPVHLGAYAPDPDRDFEDGYRKGYGTGYIHGRAGTRPYDLVDWQAARRRSTAPAHVTGLGFIVGAVVLALIVAAMGWL